LRPVRLGGSRSTAINQIFETRLRRRGHSPFCTTFHRAEFSDASGGSIAVDSLDTQTSFPNRCDQARRFGPSKAFWPVGPAGLFQLQRHFFLPSALTNDFGTKAGSSGKTCVFEVCKVALTAVLRCCVSLAILDLVGIALIHPLSAPTARHRA